MSHSPPSTSRRRPLATLGWPSSSPASLVALGPIPLLLLAWGSLLGCGYHFTGPNPSEDSTFPRQVQTVVVPVIRNQSFERLIELDLTEALVKEIHSRTPYKVIDKGRADSILSGTITEVQSIQTARRPDGGLPEAVEVRLIIDFEWKNLRTGQVIKERKGLSARGQSIPAQPVSESRAVAQRGAVQRLAQRMVTAMRTDVW